MKKAHFRFIQILLLTVVAMCLSVPTASAQDEKLVSLLGDLWTKAFETPSPENPFGTGGQAYSCIDLGGTVAPFGPEPVDSCTVPIGTQIFVAPSYECSTFENNGTTEDELQECAKDNDAQTAPTITVDGAAVPVSEVLTPLRNATLPADNIFDLPDGTTGSFAAHGWVTIFQPLIPGTHTIVINNADGSVVTTKIVVELIPQS